MVNLRTFLDLIPQFYTLSLFCVLFSFDWPENLITNVFCLYQHEKNNKLQSNVLCRIIISLEESHNESGDFRSVERARYVTEFQLSPLW